MKERKQNELTNQPNSSNLEREGDVFMAEGNNGGPEQAEPKKPEGAESSGTPPEGEAGPEGPSQSESQAKPQDQSFSGESNTPKAEKPEITDAGREVVARFYATNEPPLFTDDLVRVFRENGISEEIINRYSSHPEEALSQLVRRQILSDQERYYSGEPDSERISEYFGGAAQGRKSAEELTKLITDETVIEQLTSSTPNFSNLEGLKNFMESYVQPNELFLGYFAWFITNPELTLKDKNGNKVKISPQAKKILFEWTVEKIIGLPEHGSEEAPYKIDSYTAISHLTTLKDLSVSRFREDPEFAKYIGYLIEIREMSHELRRNLTQGDAYKDYLQKGVKAKGLDFMHNSIAGATEVVALYETYTAVKVAETGEWLTQGDVQAIDKNVRETITELQRNGQLQRNGRPLVGWEIERALSIGKTFFAGTQRFAMYSSLGDLPTESSGRVGSLPYEYIARTIATFKSSATRYFGTSGGSREFQKMLYAELKRDGINPLFGISENAWVTNGLGAVDMESHSWRSQLLFLGDMKIRIEREDNTVEEITVLDYCDRRLQEVKQQLGLDFDPALGFEGLDKDTEERVQEIFSSDEHIRNIILGQDLYLSFLVRYAPLDEGIRKKLWEKIAILDPLAVASLRPDILDSLNPTEKDTWNKVIRKLAMATTVRLRKEGEKYFDSTSGERKAQSYAELEKGARKITSGQSALIDEVLGKYFGQEFGNELSEDEEKLLRKVIGLGIARAQNLSKTKLPFTFIINDAPHVAWEKTGEGGGGLGDENLFRILLSDQGHLVNAYNEWNSAIENPADGKFAEHCIKSVEEEKLVNGRPSSQRNIEPLVKTWLKLASTNTSSLWIGGLQKILRRPTSEMTRYWYDSHISYDEEERGIFIEMLAQNGALSSDKSKGESQADRVKHETRADVPANIRKFARMIILLLGPVAGMEFLKLILPGDISKNL